MNPPAPSGRLIVTVHGIRTFGHWQERLEALVRERQPGVRVQHYKYGYFSCIAFMVPLLRWWVTRRFRSALVAACESANPERIDVVAHSFGTHLVAWGLHGVPRGRRPRIHTLILAGSVLKPSFPWQDLTDDCIGRVVNDCGTADGVLVLNQAVVLFTGMAGRIGFAGMSHDRFRNRYFAHGHSGYFLRAGLATDEFMRTWWLPLLLDDAPPEVPPDPRDASPLGGIAAFALNNAEPVKVAVVLAPFILLTILFFGLYRQADRQRAEARQRLVRLQVANAERRTEAGDLATALLWYAEALRSGDPASERDQRVRLGTTLRQHPVLTGILFLDDWLPSRAVFNRDATLIAVCGGYVTREGARVWDVQTGEPVTPLLAHENTVNAIAFSPDGARLATASSDHTARVWEARTGAAVAPPLQHDAQLVLVRFSADGGRLLTVGRASSTDGLYRASVWDVRTGELAGPPVTHAQPIGDAAFSPDAARLLTISEDGTARVVDVATGVPACPELPSGTDDSWGRKVMRAAFDPEGERVVTAADDHVDVWDARTGERLGGPWRWMSRALMQPGKSCFHLEFLEDDLVLGVNGYGDAELWRVGGESLSGPVAHGGTIASSAAVSTAGWALERTVVVGWHDGTARAWGLMSDVPLTPALAGSGAVQATFISGDGSRVGMIDVTGLVRLWDLSPRAAVVLDHAGGGLATVRSASLSPDGSQVLTVAAGGPAVQLWDAAACTPLRQFDDNAADVACLSPDGRRVLTSGPDGTVRLWDARSGEAAGELPHPAPVTVAAFSPDGEAIATGCGDGTAHVWSATDGSLLGPAIEHAAPIVAVAFAPDGRSVLVAGGVSARLYEVHTGECVTSGPRQDESGVTTAALSHDGRRIATGGLDGIARVWDAASGEPVTPPLVHPGGPRMANLSQRVTYCTFNADSTLLATTSAEGTTRLWDAATGAPAAPPLAGGDEHAAFSPDGRWVATAGTSGVARVWDARTGAAVSPPLVHEDMVSHVAFDAEGRRLVSASWDGTARIWDLAPDDRPLDELRRLAEVLADRRIDATGGVVELSTAELRERWEALAASRSAAGASRDTASGPGGAATGSHGTVPGSPGADTGSGDGATGR